jgi:hypothetical protein
MRTNFWFLHCKNFRRSAVHALSSGSSQPSFTAAMSLSHVTFEPSAFLQPPAPAQVMLFHVPSAPQKRPEDESMQDDWPALHFPPTAGLLQAVTTMMTAAANAARP